MWKRNEKLPISVRLDFEVYGYDTSFETVFTGIGGEFRVLKEIIDVEGVLLLEKDEEYLKVKHNKEFFRDAWSRLVKSRVLPSPYDRLIKKERKLI